MGYYPPPHHGPPRPHYCPPKKRKKKHHHHRPRPRWWIKWKLACMQILLPLICFQLLRTLIFPTSFDVLLLFFLIGFYAFLFFSRKY
ncbi:hypothetical protein D7Z54_16535 [Salibacterium salarium]|uniref:Uncharacterized protein n=1 Tax=Salibacterium salarium TaxID=284579 RepID=A0A3R9P7V7_9BACI|nr:hypothetical protein D7Z54_16535 [Salibacterium salarium]